MRTRRHTAAATSLIAAITLITGCGGSVHGNAPQSASSLTSGGWPKALDNAKVAALYNTANDSSQIVDCASAAQQAKLGQSPDDDHVDNVGANDGGPESSELVDCSFQAAGAEIILGPSSASTWHDPQSLNPQGLKIATTIEGAGNLTLPYTRPDGWRWQIAYSPNTPRAQALAHAVADQLAAH